MTARGDAHLRYVARRQAALLETITDLSSDLELDRVLQAVLGRAVTLLGVTGGEVAIWEEAREEMLVVASQNIGKDSRGTRPPRACLRPSTNWSCSCSPSGPRTGCRARPPC